MVLRLAVGFRFDVVFDVVFCLGCGFGHVFLYLARSFLCSYAYSVQSMRELKFRLHVSFTLQQAIRKIQLTWPQRVTRIVLFDTRSFLLLFLVVFLFVCSD